MEPTKRNGDFYERQGLLIEEEALNQAEAECLADSDARARRRDRKAERRAVLDHQYVDHFARRIRKLYPTCPAERERAIAEHACLRYSGRIGRSAEAKQLDEKAVRLAVIAHVRYAETRYDTFLAEGYERSQAHTNNPFFLPLFISPRFSTRCRPHSDPFPRNRAISEFPRMHNLVCAKRLFSGTPA